MSSHLWLPQSQGFRLPEATQTSPLGLSSREQPPTQAPLHSSAEGRKQGSRLVIRMTAGGLEPEQWFKTTVLVLNHCSGSRGSGGGKAREKGKQRRELSSVSPDINLFLTEKPLCFPIEGKQ